MDLAGKCEAVLCCRVSPKQKQEVVTLVRERVLLLLFGVVVFYGFLYYYLETKSYHFSDWRWS